MAFDFFQTLLYPFRHFPAEYYYRAPSSGEILALAWPWVMLQGVYELLGVRFTHILWQEYGPNEWSETSFPFSFNGPANITIINVLIGVALYPLVGFAIIKVWEFLIQMSLDFMGRKDISREKILATVHQSFASNIFLVVPLIGGVAQKFAAAFFLYAGLVGNLQLSKIQAIFVVLLPLIFAGLLMIFIAIFLGLQLAMP
jgi:hypothetical protein